MYVDHKTCNEKMIYEKYYNSKIEAFIVVKLCDSEVGFVFLFIA